VFDNSLKALSTTIAQNGDHITMNLFYNKKSKWLLSFILIISTISLYGCNITRNLTNNTTLVQEDEQSNSQNSNQNTSETKETEPGNENAMPPANDRLATALEFAKDLSNADFDALQKDYSYDDKMKEAMATEDTKKLVKFNNAEYGEVEEFKTPYSMIVGVYLYVMVPVKSSILDFNYQITFDKENHIVGFTYAGYLEKEAGTEKKMPSNIVETEYSFERDGYVLPGTYTAPIKGRDLPVVILVQGSGPSDRDESLYENKPFRDIAWALGQQGIATFRYDKRTYLYPEKVGEDTSFTIKDEIMNDAVAAARMVREFENVNPDKVYILGHSLGGYVIPRIAEEFTEAAGFIMMAAPAEHIKEYLLDQIEYVAMEDGTVTLEEQQAINTVTKELEQLEEPEKIPKNQLILGAYKDYWMDLSDYNAMEKAEEITSPVLVLQGERDYQVTMDQYNLWEGAFATYSNWIFHSYPSLNHLMMAGEGSPSSKEYRTKSYVDKQVINDIIEFIKK
jgi:esterase/lipase